MAPFAGAAGARACRGGASLGPPAPCMAPPQLRGPASRRRRGGAARPAAAAAAATTAPPPAADANQLSREGSYEAPLVQAQASKQDPEQPPIASALPPPAPGAPPADVAVVGCGPAGLALAAALAGRGLAVTLVGRDAPLVNNYGVWLDEFQALGLEHCLDHTWADAACYFGEGPARGPVRVGRAYGRVCRRRLRAHLLAAAAAAGVRFVPGEVTGVDAGAGGAPAALALAGEGAAPVRAGLVVLASGAAAGRFLRYEPGAPPVAAQTAYGIEAQVEGYAAAYGDEAAMVFMDFRRHHTGLHDGGARRLVPGQHPLGGADGLWGTGGEAPSFLYAMPLGGGRVFLEETCLVARPALPFAVLKRRLARRCAALGLTLGEVHEEEWSYIPTGGPLPAGDQPVVAFGAAAGMVHPATGYSLSRSLREAPAAAAAIAGALRAHPGNAAAAAAVAWRALWPPERRRQAAFHVFGMELLCRLDLAATCDFFGAFFALPPRYWRGFLAAELSSAQLLVFALLTFAIAPPGIKARLVGHLAADPAGRHLLEVYSRGWGLPSGAAAALVAALAAAAAEAPAA